MYRALLGSFVAVASIFWGLETTCAQESITVGSFKQDTHDYFLGASDGKSLKNANAIATLSGNRVFAGTDRGLFSFENGEWITTSPQITPKFLAVSNDSLYIADKSKVYTINKDGYLKTVFDSGDLTITALAVNNQTILIGLKNAGLIDSLNNKVEILENQTILDIAVNGNEITVATAKGLYIKKDNYWEPLYPSNATQGWAPKNVRAVGYNNRSQLWFACEQGVGVRGNNDVWTLFTGAEGLPYNQFRALTSGPNNEVWFATNKGAIRYTYNNWDYRQGRRWLLNDDVRDVAVASNGDAWLATAGGISRISKVTHTLAQKAKYYEKEIDKYHRRTPYGYVTNASMETPGDKASAKAFVTDNDGQYTGLYTAAVSLGYGATKDPKLKADATKAFEALAFLSEVPNGGTHPAPKGFIARAIMPTDGWNPNERDNAERDKKKRAENDHLWKVLEPRWPIDESGKWYWKTDSSSDELDGHFFAYGAYYDNVAETEAEKARVREVVSRIADHLIDHNYRLVDHDGKPTRWSDFSTEALNHHRAHWTERGLNSLSLLTYISVAHHVTGEQKYRDAYLDLVKHHSYALNGMVMPKLQFGPGSHVQFDDKMAFMNYYHLIRYETDPELLNMYYTSIYYYWNIVKQELNPFFNFVYAACCDGKIRYDQWGELDVTPTGDWLQQSIDTLKDYPLDLVDWKHTNAHRIDLIDLGDHTREPGRHIGHGHRNNGYVIPIDESQSLSWSEDRWRYDTGGAGKRLRDGAPYLLAYYMGLKHGYIKE